MSGKYPYYEAAVRDQHISLQRHNVIGHLLSGAHVKLGTVNDLAYIERYLKTTPQWRGISGHVNMPHESASLHLSYAPGPDVFELSIGDTSGDGFHTSLTWTELGQLRDLIAQLMESAK